MCWYGKPEDRRLAYEDIKCKKFIRRNEEGKYEAFFITGHIYEFGKTYCTPLYPSHVGFSSIQILRGLHCYAERVEVVKLMLREFHVRFNTFVYNMGDKAVLVECTIPKGSEYFENQDGEIVAERLIINRVIDE